MSLGPLLVAAGLPVDGTGLPVDGTGLPVEVLRALAVALVSGMATAMSAHALTRTHRG